MNSSTQQDITGSVGRGVVNANRNDILLVQRLINRYRWGSPFRPIAESGVVTEETITAIEDIQRRVLKMPRPDGRVDPGGRTFRELVRGNVPGTAPPEERPKRSLDKKLDGAAAGNAGGGEDQATARELLKDPRVRAMLDVIAYAEGTGENYGIVVKGVVVRAPSNPKLVGQRNVVVTDFSKHPNIDVRWAKGNPTSDAAGRYQFRHATWQGLNLPDFSPASQDLGAVMLMQRRRMIAPLLAGNFDQAVQNGCQEWASFPDANKGGASHFGGQPSGSLSQLGAKYKEALAKYQ